jgi:hypothetical protein
MFGPKTTSNKIMALGCFLGALQAVAAQRGVRDAAKDAQINVSVHLGTPSDKVSWDRIPQFARRILSYFTRLDSVLLSILMWLE